MPLPNMKIKYIFLTLSLLFFVCSNCFAVPQKNKYISYAEVGQGEPLVLIHPFPTDQQLWLPQLNGLKSYFRVITLDLWGFGHSEITDGQAVTMTDYANEVKQLLDQLHIKKAIIGGESMGGYIALAFLQNYPNEVEGLILSDTQSIADSMDAKTKRETAAIDVLQHGTTTLINGFMPKALSNEAPEQTKNFLQTILTRQIPGGVASALRGMALREDTSHVLINTSLPILIMTGDQDTLIAPLQSQKMHEIAKNSKLVIISHAAHLSSLEQPEAWNQAVVDRFIKQNNLAKKSG